MKSLLIALLFASTSAFALGIGNDNPGGGLGVANQEQNQGQAQGQAVIFKPVIDTNARARAEANSSVESTNRNAVSNAVDASSGSVTNNQVYQERMGRNTPGFGLGTVYPTAPCMGSSQIGGSGVGFSIGVGTSWTDDECGIRSTAASFLGLGDLQSANELLCSSKYSTVVSKCKLNAQE